MSLTDTCPICGGNKSPRWHLCNKCHEKYGTTWAAWPEWLRSFVIDNQREGRAERAANEWEASLTGRTVDEALCTRAPDEMEWSGDDLLPYAPYESDELNRIYRKANGIPERPCVGIGIAGDGVGGDSAGIV